MSENVFLKCGHLSYAFGDIPSCFICDCRDVQEEPPNLENRQAKCGNYGLRAIKSECEECKETCQHIAPSRNDLAFFRSQPDEDFDSFYCGCWGWD